MNTLRSTLGSIAATGFALALLAGCSAAPAPEGSAAPSASSAPDSSGQSATDACGILEEAVTSTTGALQEGMAEAATDPAAGIAKLQLLVDAMDGALAEIENEDVAASGTKAKDSLAGMIAELGVLAADPNADQAALMEASMQMQTDFTAIGEVC